MRNKKVLLIVQAALIAAVKTGLNYLEKDPEVNIPKLMELIDKVVPDGWYEGQRNAIRNAIQDKNSNWYKSIFRSTSNKNKQFRNGSFTSRKRNHRNGRLYFD